MRKTVVFALLAFFFVSGCSGQKGYLEGPFGNYTHETFVREGTGETGLYIEGEPWCALIDLRGFHDAGMPMESPSEFLVRKNNRGIFLRISAMKIDKTTDEDTCRNSIYRRLFHRNASDAYLKTVGSRRVMVNTFEGIKMMGYCPFYMGYCFDFQFSMDAGISEKTLAGILQSIIFVDDPALKSKLGKIFYIYDSKAQMGMPDTWTYEYKAGIHNNPSIVFKPSEGDAFSLYLSPYAGFEKRTSITRDEMQTLFDRRMAKWQDRNGDETPVIELFNDQAGLYLSYLDVKDRYFHPGDEGEYPYQRHGFMVQGKTAFFFKFFYKDEGRDEVEKGISALEHMKILDIHADPIIDIVK
jgi:hypothetical protein